ncbi:MAG: hypothetical protein RKK11_01170 [Alphaproteobacteria bacterium]
MNGVRIGDKVSTRFAAGLLKHVGVCAGCDWESGEPLIAHNSARFGKVKVSRLSEFTDGKDMTIERPDDGPSPAAIQARVSALLDEPYSAIRYNCDHFVTDVLENNPRSPQLQWLFLAGLLAVGAIYVLSSKRA